MGYEHVPITMAERCLQHLTTVPTIEAWEEMCLAATVQEGAGPMMQAARLKIPHSRHPEARAVMQSAAIARIECLRLFRRVNNAPKPR